MGHETGHQKISELVNMLIFFVRNGISSHGLVESISELAWKYDVSVCFSDEGILVDDEFFAVPGLLF